MKRTGLIGVVITGFILGGCASQPYETAIPAALTAKPVIAAQPYPLNPLIVSVRWPAVIDPSIADDLKSAWKTYGNAEDQYFSVGVLSASKTYHAAQTYIALRKAMPGASIVLEPQLVTRDKDGGIGLVSIGDTSLPVALVVDVASFDTSQFPFLGTDLSFVVRSPSALSPSNCGLLVATQHQLSQLTGTCDPASYAVTEKPPLWYVGAFDEDAKYADAITTLPLDGKHTLVYPRIRLSTAGMFGAPRPTYVIEGSPTTLEEVDRMELDPRVTNIAAVTSEAPAVLQTADASMRMLERYIRTFDPGLANAAASGVSLNSKQQSNIQLIKKLLQTELQARTKRDVTTTGWILSGDFGASFRDAREKSYSGFNKMMLTSWISAVAVTSAGAATGAFDATNPAYFSNQAAMVMAHMANVDVAMQELNASFVPAAQAMERATLDFEGTKVTVNLYDQQDLSRALREIYARYKQRPAAAAGKNQARASNTPPAKNTP